MTLPKIKNEAGAFVPDIPEGLEYKSVQLNPDGETYTVTFTAEQEAELYISVAQCRSQLRRMELFNVVEDYMWNTEDKEEKDFWYHGNRFYRYSPTIEKLGKMLQIDLDEFWEAAKKIHK